MLFSCQFESSPFGAWRHHLSPASGGTIGWGRTFRNGSQRGPLFSPVLPSVRENEGQHRAHEEDGVLNARRHEEVGYHVHEDHHRRKLPAPGIDPVPLDPGSPQDDVGGKGHEKLEQADEDDVFRHIQSEQVHPRHKKDGKKHRSCRYGNSFQESLPGNGFPHVQRRFPPGEEGDEKGGKDVLRHEEKIGMVRCQWFILS